MKNAARLWGVVPAAGIGRRMRADRPKQYLTLAGKSVIEQTLQRLAQVPGLQGIVVALSEDDPHWGRLESASSIPLYRAPGGPERYASVLNALDRLAEIAGEDDWVLVHDAARPCVRVSDIQRLIEVAAGEVGALLALPVVDTKKRGDDAGHVIGTVDRVNLWRALTPQLFRLGMLREALATAVRDGINITDESSAMEHAGYRPLLVEGSEDNIKITRPKDLALAELYLQAQAEGRI